MGETTINVGNLGIPTAGTPVVDGQRAYVTDEGRLLALDLACDVVAWERPGAYQWVPAIDDRNVYAIVNGQVEARDRDDGSLLWTWVPQAALTAIGSAIATRNLLFVRLRSQGWDETETLVALDLQARKVVWSIEVGGALALGNGLLVIAGRSTGKVVGIEVD